MQEQRGDGGGRRSSLLSPLMLLSVPTLLVPAAAVAAAGGAAGRCCHRSRYALSSASARAVNKNSNSATLSVLLSLGVQGLPPIGHRRIFVPLFRSSRAQPHPPLHPSSPACSRCTALYPSPSSTCYHSRNGPTAVSRARGGARGDGRGTRGVE